MTRQVGDVKRGYVESAWGQFEILGDRKGTLEALKLGTRRLPQKASPKVGHGASSGRRATKIRRAPERRG